MYKILKAVGIREINRKKENETTGKLKWRCIKKI